jgi:hypothetical protein
MISLGRLSISASLAKAPTFISLYIPYYTIFADEKGGRNGQAPGCAL